MSQPSSSPPIYIYGCGGHGRVILDILQSQNRAIAGIVDDHPAPTQDNFQGIPLSTPDALLPVLDPSVCQWIIAIGNNAIRQTIAQTLQTLNHTFATIIHSSAQIGSRVTIGAGTVIMANTVINCDTVIGDHVILNTGSTLDHNCTLGDFCHIAPGSTLCGHVTVGAGTWLQVGSKVAPGVTIGDNLIGPAGEIYVK